MPIVIDQRVIDYCNKHKICKGCKFIGSCVAPESDSKFDVWITNQQNMILEYLNVKKLGK